jgi:phage terminase small subunit
LTDREKAKVLYLSGKKVVEIASELDIKEGTLRSWKSRGKWPARLQRKNATKKQSIARGNTTFDNDDSGISEQQKNFCLYYVKFFNATQAAISAGYAKTSAHVEGCRLLKNDKVRAEIKRLKSAMAAELFVEAEDVLMLYFKIAFGDIGEYVTFGRRDVQVMSAFGPVYEGKGKNKKPVMKTVNYVDLSEMDYVDTSLISEISQGREGVKIKLHDKMKAMEFLAKYFELNPMDMHKAEYDRAKQQLEREVFEHRKKQDEESIW